ncbi:MAG: hypothetical protein IPJ34_10225 [Myxococcales bacterium]|nr:hypothetical protein [Myxococcales bacterium]MBL8720520.1 hypothetical protein [Myxococcales bacterium]
MAARLLDALALLMLVLAGVAFLFGARHIASREDLHAIYWMVVGIAAIRAVSSLARADRA